MKILYSILFLFVFGQTTCFSQIRKTSSNSFVLKGVVMDEQSSTPISNVNIEINKGDYTTTNLEGRFAINAVIGDELVVKSDAFSTVYYVVETKEFVTVRVRQIEGSGVSKVSPYRSHDDFITYIDSAKQFITKDAKKSLDYVTKALEANTDKSTTLLQKSMAFETLGDIYMFWKIYDLAIDNYKRSIADQSNPSKQIKLADAFGKNKNYQEALTLYRVLREGSLTTFQEVLVLEGLGDTYKATREITKSVSNYQEALEIARAGDMSNRVTNLNAKIADAYAQDGNTSEAEDYYDNTLELSKRESTKRAAEAKNTVADYYNSSGDYEKEIQLREEALDDIEVIGNMSIATDDVSSPLTPQRQNYKIANAFIGQEKYKEAIPYLEKSIAEADEKEDLNVEKDARRKLSEVYRDIGAFDKAAEGYERYVEVVDELYIKKEQEISQATRFAREIAEKQNRIAGLENERELNASKYKLAFENQELIETNNRTQKWIIVSLLCIALLLLYAAYSQFKNIKQQKFANNVLALKSLRTQMNPHFIFNALNSVNSFIASNDERAANKYLSEFSQLMRSVLENSEQDFIPLSKEIELLEIYTKLEHFRFKDKFEYIIDVDAAIAITDFIIPPMLLQPYVENAVWHGLRYKKTKGHLSISFKKIDHETIKICIEDDGIGRVQSAAMKTEHQKKQKSKGMGNIKKRISILNEMYKDKVDVLIRDAQADATGTRVTLLIKKD
jgi:tetratricopeptide (TPR) repeat protein